MKFQLYDDIRYAMARGVVIVCVYVSGIVRGSGHI